MSRLTSEQLYAEIGFANCCDEGLTYDYVKTELIDKAEQGDSVAIYKLNLIKRYCTDEKISEYAAQALRRFDEVVEAVESKVEEEEAVG